LVLIEYSGEEENFDINQFNRYFETFSKLWKFAEEKEKQPLIHRALLVISADKKLGYLEHTKHNEKYTFCTFNIDLREKNENWRKVFGKDCFKNLLDKIDNNNIENSLKQIINNYQFNCNDWKSYFINPNKNWSVLDQTKYYQIYKKNNIIHLNRGDVKVTSWQWRRFYDLYNYYLYRLLRYDINIIENTSFNKIEPFPNTEYPCFYIDGYNIQNHHFALDIFFEPKTNKFLIRFFDRKKQDISENLLEFLQNNKFEKDKYEKIREYGYWNDKYKLCEMKELIKFFETFLKEIVNHT